MIGNNTGCIKQKLKPFLIKREREIERERLLIYRLPNRTTQQIMSWKGTYPMRPFFLDDELFRMKHNTQNANGKMPK